MAAGTLGAGGGGGGWSTKHRRELPHIPGQGQLLKLTGCDGTGMAERSHPASEVWGNGREEPHCI